jgi:8-oxo-dGTP diphosphatase
MPVTDQGKLSDRYKIVPRTLIFIFQGGKVLLLKGSPQKRLWANLYNGVGGHIERGENIYSSAKRELMEETGILTDNFWLCGVIMIDAGEDAGIGIFVFKGVLDFESVHGNEVFHSEDGILEWISIEEVFGLPLVEDLSVLLPQVINARKGDPPFSALYTYNGEGKISASFFG